MVGWYHQLDGHDFEQAPGVGEGQGSLAYCSPWGHKESDMTERQNNRFLWRSILNILRLCHLLSFFYNLTIQQL